MFAKLFGSKSKEITDPKHQLWVKWFTCDPPKQSHVQQLNPKILSLYSQIEEQLYTKQQINQQRTVGDEEFFSNLFKLNEPLNEKTKNLLSFLVTSSSTMGRNEKTLAIIMTPIMQHVIKYTFQFDSYINEIVNGRSEYLEKAQDAYIILTYIFSLKNEAISDPLYLFGDFYEKLSTLLKADIFIENFTPEILNITLNYLNSLEDNSTDVFPLFKFIVSYFEYWIQKFHTERFTTASLTECIAICNALTRIKPDFAIMYKAALIDPILNSGLNMLSFLFITTMNKVTTKEIAMLGNAFLKFLEYYTSLGTIFANYIWEHQFLHFIPGFAMWAIDRFPIVEFPEEKEEFCESDLKFFKHKQLDPPIFEFIVDKLQQNLSRDSKMHNVADSDQIMQYSVIGEIDERISAIPELRNCFTSLSSLFTHSNSKRFIAVFTDVFMQYINKLISDQKQVFTFIHSPQLLASSFIYFFSQLLLTGSTNDIVDVLRKSNGFVQLTNTFVFSQKYNTWSIDMDRADNQFFYETRFKVYTLFANCYANNSSSHQLILSALSNIFTSSPPIIDELIKFTIILFRTHPEKFSQAVINTNLIDTASQYMVDLQRTNISMIDENYDSGKIQLLRQSRIHIFHFFDLLACIDLSRSQIFSTDLFARSLLHFFFEDATQEYALDMWKNGLLIDSGLFIDQTNTPLDHMFPLQENLFKEALNHVDDPKWISLITKYLNLLSEVLLLNRKTLIESFDKYKTYDTIVLLPDISTDHDTVIEMINTILLIFFYLVQNSPKVRKILCHKPMEIISKKLSTLDFGKKTVNRLLDLIFERQINLDKLPKNIDIHDSKIIPFIHDATKHLEWHEYIFNYINHVCAPSVTNKLKVFQSKTPLVILKYIQSFPVFPSPSKDGKYSPTVNSLLILFSTVSSAVFKWKTFYEAVKSMKPVNDKRNWWTVQLISTFSTILSEISSKPPSSFFHFDGRHSGIDLPPIPSGYLSNGMTFIVRLELGANWNLEGHRACLLSLVDKSGAAFELYFEGKLLVFEYKRGKDKDFKIIMSKLLKSNKIAPLEFTPNVWLRIVFTIDNKCNAALYVDKICYHKFIIKGGLKFDGVIQNGKIACSSPTSTSVSEDPLIANISSIYLFDRSLDQDMISKLSSLPDDYCFGFSPRQAAIFPDAPKELFTDEMNQSLLLCYNARMTSGTTCANFAQRGLGNAEIRGQIIPFSTSFIDVATNMGGLKLFLPLLKHVDFSIANEETNDSMNFLLSLLGLFRQFFQSSDEIVRDFIQSGSMKAMAYLLSTISTASISTRTISQLCDIFSTIKKDEYKLEMIREIFLNFSLWRNYTDHIQIAMIEMTWNKIYSKNPDLLMRTTNIKTLILLLVDERNEKIRASFWKFIKNFAVHKFTEEDQETLYEAAFSNIGNSLLLEVLDCIHYFMKERCHKFHKIVESHDFYLPFSHLVASPDEMIRINVLRIVCLIYDLQLSGEIQSDGTPIKTMFQNAILAIIAMFNPTNITEKTWTYATMLFIDSPKYQSGLFPFISYLSSSYEPKVINEFLTIIEKDFVVLEGETNIQISDSPGWMIWMFNFMIQADRTHVVFGENEVINKLFTNVLVSLLISGLPALTSFVGFMCQLMSFRKIDLTLMMRNIFLEIIALLPINKLSPDNIQLIFVPIFRFIFYPTKRERFSKNIQLYQNGEIVSELKNFIDGTYFYDYLTLPFKCEPKSSEQTVFSMRITEDGTWLDRKLAKRLAKLFIKLPFQVKEFTELKIKASDAISFIFSNIIQTNNTSIERIATYINLIQPIIANEQSSIAILAQGILRITMRNRKENATLFTAFLQTFTSQFMRVLRRQVIDQSIINEVQPLADFNEFIREPVAQFYQIIAEREAEKTTKAANAAINGEITRITEEISALYPKPTLLLHENRFQIRLNAFTHEFQIQRIATEKSWRRLWREMSTNGSPWSTVENAQHWKCSQRWDSHYRRVFLKPNIEFDSHKKASFRRDASSDAQAQEYYQDWIKTHPEGNIVHETNKIDDAIDNADEDQAQPKDYSITCSCKLITIERNYEGTFFMNEREIAFDGIEGQDSMTSSNPNQKSIQFFLDDVDMVLRRAYLHIDSGLEFFLKKRRSFFIMFNKMSDRQNVLRALKPRQNQMVIQMSDNVSSISAFQDATNQWKQGNMSNYDYLMKVNFFAGRSFNDLSQYPVFPWILKDYESETIDINDPNIYRDLSKPLGTLNEKRLNSCLNNYRECPESPEKCMYRMHYSNAFYVLNFLVRMEPFTTLHVEVNDSKFDKANRMFSGIGRAWKAVTSNLPDFRELIPEFYSCPEFLSNENEFDLGILDDNTRNSDVTLPKWAKSPSDFIAKHRRCFESPYVSQHLNEWIDLIFGFKQQGQAAVNANNTFHKYCYRSSVTREVLNDPDMLQTIQFTAGNVGIIPCQIFTSPHPKREIQSIPNVNLAVKKNVRLLSPETKLMCFAPTGKSSFLALSSNSCIYSVLFNTSVSSLANQQSAQAEAPLITEIGNISEFAFLSGSSEKSFAYFSETSRFVVSSPWDSCFHVFKVDNSQINYLFTERQKCALIYSIYPIDRNILLTVWRDSSISLYNIEKQEQNYRITPHHVNVVDTDGISSLDLLSSVDKDGIVVLSRLSTGSFIRSFQAKDHVQKILLIELGFIVIASSAANGGTCLTIYTINTKEIGSTVLEGNILSWTKVGSDFNQMILISLDNGKVCSIKIPDLEVATEESLECNIVSLNYEPTLKGVIGKDSKSRIFFFQCL